MLFIVPPACGWLCRISATGARGRGPQRQPLQRDAGLDADAAQTARRILQIAPGHDAELDELRKLTRDGKDWIARYQAQEITRTGITSLKVGFNSVHGRMPSVGTGAMLANKDMLAIGVLIVAARG